MTPRPNWPEANRDLTPGDPEGWTLLSFEKSRKRLVDLRDVDTTTERRRATT